MKCFIAKTTLFLVFTSILLTGCGRIYTKDIDQPTKEMLLGNAGEIPVQASQQQKIVPPQTPADYKGDPYFYIPSIEYEILTTSAGEDVSYPLLSPQKQQKLKEMRVWSENGGWMTPEGPITEEAFQRMCLDIIADGFSDLEMAQFIILEGLSETSRKYAAEYAQNALDANPNDYQTLYVWTQTQTDNAKRIQGNRKLLKQNPNHAKVLFQLGSLLIDWEQKTKGAFEESIGYLKRSAALDPDYARGQAYRFLGNIHVHLGDVEKGLAFYRLAQEIYDWEPTREAIVRIEKGDRP